VFFGVTAVTALYAAVVWYPLASRNVVVGFRGELDGGTFQLAQVFSGSPAEQAGLAPGDRVDALGGRTAAAWWQLYRDARQDYLDDRAALRNLPFAVAGTIGGQAGTVQVVPRPVTAREILAGSGIRFLLAAVFIGFGCVLALARSRDPTAGFVAACLGVAALWFVASRPDWPAFFSPYLPVVHGWRFVLNEFVDLLALQVTIAMLVHVVLLFPERRPVLDDYPWLPAFLYGAPVAFLAAVALLKHGVLVDRLGAVHNVRLWINTFLMISAAAILLHGYRTCESALQRERSRWVVAALAACTAWHLLAWNVPILLMGRGLVPEYEWVLLPFVSVPLAITVAINTHQLFGIRGLVRRRLRLLKALLDREQREVDRRDRRIHALEEEIAGLRNELTHYMAAEEVADASGEHEGGALERLLVRYPALRAAREQGFVCESNAWVDVFEKLLIAARGTQPVLIAGESGTGKTQCARLVHELGDRAGGPYREISCAQFEHADPAIPLGRLFGIGIGHGLPNVAREGQRGLLAEVDGGTLFLDDFDRLPLNVQDLLLFPLEGKAFEPGIGSGPARRVDVKFVVATNREPGELVATGKMHADVLSRLAVRVVVPPLRERPQDVPALAQRFARQAGAELGHEIATVSHNALTLLTAYGFASGNARALKAEIHAAAGKAMLENDVVLRAGYLSEAVRQGPGGGRTTAARKAPDAPVAATGAVARELAVLRRNGFRVRESEIELGLSQQSRTLSAHLRGLCLQALVDAQFDAEAGARALTASSEPALVGRVAGKIRRFEQNVRASVAQGTERRLFRRTPAAYHAALDRVIAHLRAGSQGPAGGGAGT